MSLVDKIQPNAQNIMKSTKIIPTNTESNFELDELFFSITDKKGIITACNDIFVRVSEYESEELLGEPHNCIRHPDMPRCVFKLFWEFLSDGKLMGAYVKNMSKTGKYYWVYALATPIEEGYISIRIRPSSKFLPVIKTLYSELLEIEASHEEDWRKGMEEAYNVLHSRLETLGYQSYDDFLSDSLREELQSRNTLLKEKHGKRSSSKSEIPALFNQVMALAQKREMLLSKSSYLSNFAKELELVAINSTVRANFLGRIGAPLSIIGKEISLMSQTIKKEIEIFSNTSKTLVSEIDNASLSLAISSLQQEMSESFQRTGERSKLSIEEQIKELGAPNKELAQILASNANINSSSAMQVLRELLNSMNRFESTITSLSKVFQVLQFSYVAGCAEIARISEESDFKPLFDNLRSISDLGKTELGELDSTLSLIKGSINNSVNIYNNLH